MQRLGTENVAAVVQWNRLRSYGHVLRKDDEIEDWAKIAQLNVKGTKQSGRPGKKWKKIVGRDMLDLELTPDDAMDHDRRKAKIKRYWWNSNYWGDKRWVWIVNVSAAGSHTWSWIKGRKQVCSYCLEKAKLPYA